MADFSTTTRTAGTPDTPAAPGGTGASAPGAPGTSTSTAQSGGGSLAGGIVDKVREKATAQLASQKDRAFDGIGTVAQAVRQSTHQLRDQQHETLAGYVEQAADQIDRFAQQLKNKDVTKLLDDAQRLARRQPALFVGSAFAVGLLGARFLKSSTRERDDAYGSDVYGGSGTVSDRDRPGRYAQGRQNRDTSRAGGQSSAQSAGVSPASGAGPIASGSTYSSPSDKSTSESATTPSPSGAGTGGGTASGVASGSASGTTRGRGGKNDVPSTSSPGRSRRSGSENERS